MYIKIKKSEDEGDEESKEDESSPNRLNLSREKSVRDQLAP